MALIDRYLKKKDSKIELERSRPLLIDKYSPRKETPFTVEPEKKPLMSKIKEVGVGVGKFFARVGVEAANLLSSTLDFTADFLAGQAEKQTRKLSIGVGPFGIPIGKETEARKKAADRWKSFYEQTGGEATEKIKTFTEELREIDFIQPSEEWVNASTKEKFTKRLPETILNIGPGVVASLGMFAINPIAGFAASAGSVADEVKTIAIEEGVNEERAELLGLGTGLLVGWLDKIVPDEVFSPAQKKAFVGGFAKRIIKTGLKETATEVVQENIQLLAEATVREDVTKDEVVFRNLMSGLGGLLGGVGAQTTVSFVNGVRSGDIAGLEEDFDKPVEVVKKPEVEKVVPKAPVKPEAKVVISKPKTKEVIALEKLREPMQAQLKALKKLRSNLRDEGKDVTSVAVKIEELEGKSKGLSIQISQLTKKPPVVVPKPKIKEVTEKQIKTTKNLKDTKSTLRNIRQELSEAVTEAEGLATVAQEKRAGVNVENINKLKRIYALNKKFQEGDIETIRASRTGGLLNTVVENVQEIYPHMSEQEAFDFALELPTKAQESARTPGIRELEKKEKKLSKFLALLKTRQGELKIQEDDELSKEWVRALAIQEKLISIVKVPEKQLPVGEGKERVSRLQARLKGALNAASQEDIEELGLSTYNQMNQDIQIAKASEYVINNTEDAIRVVFGEIDPPKGILQNSVLVALIELGKTDTDVAIKVATLTATRFGQEINILKKILADNPVVMMQDIVNIRIETYEKKTGKIAKQRIKAEVKKIGGEIKVPDGKNWDSFLNSIKC